MNTDTRYSPYKNITVDALNKLIQSKKIITEDIHKDIDRDADIERARPVEITENTPIKHVSSAENDIYKNIFEYIIVFTGNKNPDENKTLKNIYDAVKNLKKHNAEVIPEIICLKTGTVICDDSGNLIKISDEDISVNINEKKMDNTNTLILSRLSAQDTTNCEYTIKLLQDRGFLVLNPVRYAELASNKYDTACLLKKAGLPQPDFCLMTNELMQNDEQYLEKIKTIYPDWKDRGDNSDKNVVIKILNGHGGAGVACVDGNKLRAVLQLIFAVNHSEKLLLQKYEKAKGGDIRVHVLTLRDKQIILGAMKRVKLPNDFRSNVSLGAAIENIELTENQKIIACKAAKVSKLPWCAVDIMPIENNGDKETAEDVILELNASPGTDGISKSLGINFINLLLNNLLDSNAFVLQPKTAGIIETITIKFSDFSYKNFLAKLDTGNSTRASVVEIGKYSWDRENKKISFKIDSETLTFDVVDVSVPKNNEKTEERPIIIVPEVLLGMRKYKNCKIALVEKRNRSTNALLNVDFLSKLGYIIDPVNTHILTREMEKIKII